AQADHLTPSHHGGAAECGDVAVLLHGLEHEVPAFLTGQGQHVEGGINLGIVLAFRSSLDIEPKGVAELPEIAVAESPAHAPVGGAAVVAVVDFNAAVQGQFVLDVQVDVHRAGQHAGTDFGGDTQAGLLVEGDDVALHLIEIGDAAL